MPLIYGAFYEDVTDAFLMLSHTPSLIPENTLAILERFVVLLYNRTSELFHVNEARQHLFARRGRTLENIPRTTPDLVQCTLNAAFLGVHVWGQVLTKDPKLPSPGFGGGRRRKMD